VDAVVSRLQPVVRLGHCMHWLSCTAALLLGLCRPLKDCHDLHHGVSANLLYGFERFNLQNIQSGHVNMTFERESHLKFI
jgi:hypothetical protein